MRILFVSSQYPPYELGGYEQLCQEVTAELMERGHEVRILTSRYGLQPQDPIRVGNVDRSLHLMADIHYYKPLDFFLHLPRQERTNLEVFRGSIDEFKPDVVMFWGMFALSHSLPYWAERWLPGRISYYVASYWPLDEDLHYAYWKSPANRRVTEIIKRPLREIALGKLRREGYPPALKLDNVICCSEYVRDRLAEAGLLRQEAGVVYAGSNPDLFRDRTAEESPRADEPLHLLYFGRLVPEKGVHTAIEALGLLKHDGLAERVKLTILGDGHPDYKKQLVQETRELEIEDRVEFVPKIGREEIPEYLSQFDVFLFTSTWPEPFGRTIIEAMMAGLVVIGSDVGGSREIFRDYEPGQLFQAGDARELRDRIQRVLDDPGLRSRLAHSGRKLPFERFTIHQMTDGIEAFLLDVKARAGAETRDP